MDLTDSARKFILQNSSKAVSTIRRNLADRNIKVSTKDIKNFIGSLDLDKLEHFSRNKFSKMIVFPYIGGWFFDIGFNAKTGMWALFCHGNSGYIVPYIINAKTTANLQKVVEEFVSDCENLEVAIKEGDHTKYATVNYPVRVIIADEEKGLMGVKVPGVEIKQFNAGENHRTLSRINGFMKHLKDWALENNLIGKQTKNIYISDEDMADKVLEWNTRTYRALNCCPGEILLDRDLEEAYICRALYVNEGKDAEVADTFETGMTVKVRNDSRKVFGRQKEGALLRGHYVIDEIVEGNRVRVHNALNPEESFVTNLNYIESGGKTKVAEAWKDLEGAQAPEMNQELRRLPKKVLTKRYSHDLDRSYVALTRNQTRELGLQEPVVSSVVNSRQRKQSQRSKNQRKKAAADKEPELQINLEKEVNYENPVEKINKPLTLEDLPYSEKERIIKLLFNTQREQEFQRGFAMNFSDEQMYKELNEIAKKLTNKEVKFFNAVPKQRRGSPRLAEKALREMKQVFEDPEARQQDIWNSNGYEVSGRMLKTKKRVS